MGYKVAAPDDPRTLRNAANSPFDVNRLSQIHCPILVGRVDETVLSGADELTLRGEGVNVLDMPVKLPYEEFRVPRFIPEWVHNVIEEVTKFEGTNVTDTSSWHMYLTMNQSVTGANVSQRRSGAHIDGMQGSAYPEPLLGCHAYLLSSSAPTVFYPHPFELEGFDARRDNLYRILENSKDSTRAWTGGKGEVIGASCYCVHEAGVSAEGGPRTFLRIEFSRKRFDREENTRNPLIDTSSWQYRPRPIPGYLR